MLRQLLIERFHVTVHAGTKRVPGYLLVVAKGGPKLKTSEVDALQQGFKAGAPFHSFIYDGYIRARGNDLNGIAALLSAQVDAPVFDQTGISGAFDVDLHFAKANDTESEWPPFFVAVQDQLGLKLEPQKVTINTLVIDHVDSFPTPN